MLKTATSAMIFLRKSQVQEDWYRFRRLKTPSTVVHNMIDYEFDLLATTEFYIPANYRKCILEVANKVNGEILKC